MNTQTNQKALRTLGSLLILFAPLISYIVMEICEDIIGSITVNFYEINHLFQFELYVSLLIIGIFTYIRSKNTKDDKAND